uniref:SURF1-like protein n=1 Tax=Cyclophora tenuis TaxID=216820 RepID=A0A7S1GK23_CYCTE
MGCWQTQRYFEKVVAIEQREKDLAIAPEPLDDTQPQGLRRRLAEGEFLHNREILVGPRGPPPGALASSGPSAGRSGGGMSVSPQGYFVITPFRTVSGQIVMINRGWIPRHFPDGGVSWEKTSGTVGVTVVPSKGEEPRFMTPEHNFDKSPPRFFWMDKKTLEEIAEVPQGQGILLKQVGDGQEKSTFPILPPLETIGEFKTTPAVHVGYAFTWFGLSGAGLYMTRKLITRGRG